MDFFKEKASSMKAGTKVDEQNLNIHDVELQA